MTTAPGPANVTPERIFESLNAYQKTAALKTAIELDVFSAIAEGATTQVNYHYTLADSPAWATAAETQNAFPRLHSDLTQPQTGQATLIDTNNGWQVAVAQPTHSSGADGQIVE